MKLTLGGAGEDEGHAHFYVNDFLIGQFYESPIALNNHPAGKHTYKVSLALNNHVEFEVWKQFDIQITE